MMHTDKVKGSDRDNLIWYRGDICGKSSVTMSINYVAYSDLHYLGIVRYLKSDEIEYGD